MPGRMYEPHESEEAEAHLLWLEEHQPERLEEMLRNETLKDHLTKVAEAAWEARAKLDRERPDWQGEMKRELAWSGLVIPDDPEFDAFDPPEMSPEGQKLLRQFRREHLGET